MLCAAAGYQQAALRLKPVLAWTECQAFNILLGALGRCTPISHCTIAPPSPRHRFTPDPRSHTATPSALQRGTATATGPRSGQRRRRPEGTQTRRPLVRLDLRCLRCRRHERPACGVGCEAGSGRCGRLSTAGRNGACQKSAGVTSPQGSQVRSGHKSAGVTSPQRTQVRRGHESAGGS